MYIFDIETDGLDPSRVHCMVLFDTETNQIHYYRPNNIDLGVDKLVNAGSTPIVGHNIIDFDIPAIEKVFKVQIPREHVVDTLVLSRLLHPTLKEDDFKKLQIPARYRGSHSLKAWGYRLGVLKGTYAEDNGENSWLSFNEDMLTYCEQDVKVTTALYDSLSSAGNETTAEAIELEMQAQLLMTKMRQNGFPFNKPFADMLVHTLRTKSTELVAKITALVPPIPDKVFIPKRDNKTLGYKKGVPIQRYKEFNPDSRFQLRYIITEHYGYLPEKKSLYDETSGNLKIDEHTFHYIIHEDNNAPDKVKELAVLYDEYLMLSKRLGQVRDGKNAWIKLYNEETGCIHGRINPNGTVSGRATHSQPNISQVPNSHSPYGKECRELFCVPDGWVEIGIDVSGLELRCLSHYLYPFDNGEYADEVLNGDIHTKNMNSAGLTERDHAKTFIYAFLYGAGDAKIGQIVGGTANDGKVLKKKFLDNTPQIVKLKQAIDRTLFYPKKNNNNYREPLRWRRTYLKGLDGRRLYVRSQHSALNLLLQGCGAIICKKWIVELEKKLREKYGYGWNKDFVFLTWSHDEVQIAVRENGIDPAEVAQMSQAVMQDIQQEFNFKVQIDTEMKVGKNWAECH